MIEPSLISSLTALSAMESKTACGSEGMEEVVRSTESWTILILILSWMVLSGGGMLLLVECCDIPAA